MKGSESNEIHILRSEPEDRQIHGMRDRETFLCNLSIS